MDELSLEIFAPSRTNLMKIYEILKCCKDTPMSVNQIRTCAVINSSASILEIVTYLVSKGILMEISPMEYEERVRVPPRADVYYETSETGRDAIKMFESILDFLGFKKLRLRRFTLRT